MSNVQFVVGFSLFKGFASSRNKILTLYMY